MTVTRAEVEAMVGKRVTITWRCDRAETLATLTQLDRTTARVTFRNGYQATLSLEPVHKDAGWTIREGWGEELESLLARKAEEG